MGGAAGLFGGGAKGKGGGGFADWSKGAGGGGKSAVGTPVTNPGPTNGLGGNGGAGLTISLNLVCSSV